MQQFAGRYIIMRNCKATARRAQMTPLSRPFTDHKDATLHMEVLKEYIDQSKGKDIFLVQIVEPYKFDDEKA